ncbi:glycine receptor subunit alpha-1-like [Haliotis cracherodii]|uniref:glycine receptor subunit alpha-1-like n=1 Tax=Haliotis cracherodii TaxID=6455 RepID=UPI0039EC6EC0
MTPVIVGGKSFERDELWEHIFEISGCVKMACRFSVLVVFALVSLSLPRAHGADSNITERDVLNRLLDPDCYDATIRPGVDEGEATRVEIDMALNSVGPVSNIKMEVSTSFFLRQQWRDARLMYDDFNRSIVISHKRLGSLWVPDLYFTQSKHEILHNLTTPNVMIRLSPNGTVLFTQRLSVIVQCQMNLVKFPMDSQTCYIAMESYSFTADSLYFRWSGHRQATSVQPEANIPDFSISDVIAEDCSSTYAIGTFTCLRAVLHLKREIGFYATQTYIPSILIVVLSWASFWIDHEAVPARISVGLLTVLTITTQSSSARAQLPRVPYVKAIDVWMTSCLVFVFAAYMEYAVVTVLSRRFKKLKAGGNHKEKIVSMATSKKYAIETRDTNDNDLLAHEGRRDPGRNVDKASRSVFPVAFLVFNIVYWMYYVLSRQPILENGRIK